jgi:hypothetical protein
VVHEHHRHQPRVGAQQAGQGGEVHNAVTADRQIVHREPAPGELPQRLDDARVLDRAGDDVAGRVAGEAEQGEVVRLGGAAGEDHFVGVSAEQGGDALAGVLERPAGLAAGPVGAGRVAEWPGQQRPHGVPGFGQQRRGRGVVEVEAGHRAGRSRRGGAYK